MEAGVREAPSVVITMHDDTMSIYLTSYCRWLNPDILVVSRLTHGCHLEAIHRAGAGFVRSYGTLAESGIGARTGLIVIGIEENGHIATNPSGGTRLPAGAELVMMGSSKQQEAFGRMYDWAPSGRDGGRWILNRVQDRLWSVFQRNDV